MISIEPAPMLEDKEKWYVFNLIRIITMVIVIIKAAENFSKSSKGNQYLIL